MNDLDLERDFEAFKAGGQKLYMTRGKPSAEQLQLSMGLLDTVTSLTDFEGLKGSDLRNYGGLDGIEPAKKLMSEFLNCPAEETMVLGNSSLSIMYELISKAMTHGVLNSTPWSKLDEVIFVCPTPGYDRHFAICEYFGIKMISVPLFDDGPNMKQVAKLVEGNPNVKGIWCVPCHSNPSGAIYSNEAVQSLASLKPAAQDFRIYWDNAYAIHDLYWDGEKSSKTEPLTRFREACIKAGNADIYYAFASTSKVTFAGAGIAAVSTSKANLDDIKNPLRYKTIGPDKINQLRHVLFFSENDSLEAHMKKHAELLRPRFKLVIDTIANEIESLGLGTCTRPQGGYFVSFESSEGKASEIVELCKDLGVKLTPAGSAFPYGIDPNNSNIRLAPSYPSMEELKSAMKAFVLAVKAAS